MPDSVLPKDISDDRTQRTNRAIRLLISGLILAAISAGVIGQTTEEDEDVLRALIPVVMTALYYRAEPE